MSTEHDLDGPSGAEAVPPLPPGPEARTLFAIDGKDLDPRDVDPPVIAWSVARSAFLAWLWRWWERFRDGRGTLSAKGISFYAFFGVVVIWHPPAGRRTAAPTSGPP